MREETRGVSVSCLWTWQPCAVCVIDVLLTHFSESRHVALVHLSVFVSLKKSPLLLLHAVLNNISIIFPSLLVKSVFHWRSHDNVL